MKSVSGKVVSSKPISLFKASKILSNFAAVENGASQSVQVYLRRSAAAFEELIQVHKEIKTPNIDQQGEKHHNRRIEIDKRNENLEKAETSQQLESDRKIGKHKKHEEKLEESDEQNNVQFGEGEKKSKKHEGVEREYESKEFDERIHNAESNFVEREDEKMNKGKIRELDERRDNGEVREDVWKDEGGDSLRKREKKMKKKKKNKGLEMEDEDEKKQEKDVELNKLEAGEAGIERDDVNEGKEKSKKKRKNREVDGDNELVHDSVEQCGLNKKKKKKRKTEGEFK